jgi:hypothetical protein
MATELTQERLKEILDYDPETGVFMWKVPGPKRRLDRPAGCYNVLKACHEIRVDYRLWKAHRLAFLWMTGSVPQYVDHIDGDARNNAWANIRPATLSQNAWNITAARKNNTSGVKGVSLHKPTGKWSAEIWVNSKKRVLGLHETIEGAAQARAAAEAHHHGEYARKASYAFIIGTLHV